MIADNIKKNLGSALKEGDDIKVSTLRLLLAAIQSREKEKRYKESAKDDFILGDEDIVEVVRSEAKKRKEAIKSFQEGHREELAEKEKKELKILSEYLPAEISEAEIEETVMTAIKETEAKNIKDIGKVMSAVLAKIKGRADGAKVSEIVRKNLANED